MIENKGEIGMESAEEMREKNCPERYLRELCGPSLGQSGIELIAAERRRQMESEGWTPDHDDEHRYCELSQAACCYASEAWVAYPEVPANWPWAIEWWKPSRDPIRNLVKAGALIAAEIDKIQRKRSRNA